MCPYDGGILAADWVLCAGSNAGRLEVQQVWVLWWIYQTDKKSRRRVDQNNTFQI